MISDVNVDVHESGMPEVNVDEDCLNVNMDVDVSGYKLPQRRKVKGRPRGSKTTGVDGVRLRGCKLKPFNQKTKLDQQNIVLGMIVKSPVRGKKRLYDDMDIKEVTDVSTAVLDKDFDIGLAARKLTDGARKKAERAVTVKIQINEYVCPVCKEVCGEEPGDRDSIYCDSCMNWLHMFPCSGERKKPAQNAKKWFCGECKKTQ